MELRGSGATELEEDDDEDVLPFRAPRRDLESVTWGKDSETGLRLFLKRATQQQRFGPSVFQNGRFI